MQDLKEPELVLRLEQLRQIKLMEDHTLNMHS